MHLQLLLNFTGFVRFRIGRGESSERTGGLYERIKTTDIKAQKCRRATYRRFDPLPSSTLGEFLRFRLLLSSYSGGVPLPGSLVPPPPP